MSIYSKTDRLPCWMAIKPLAYAASLFMPKCHEENRKCFVSYLSNSAVCKYVRTRSAEDAFLCQPSIVKLRVSHELLKEHLRSVNHA